MILVRNAFDIDAVLRGLNISLQGIAAGGGDDGVARLLANWEISWWRTTRRLNCT